MRSLLYGLAALILVSGCGMQSLTETEAMEVLQGVPMNAGEQNILGTTSSTSYAAFEKVLSRYAGEERGAVSTQKPSKIKTLRNLFTLVQSGEANNVDELAYGLVEMDGGNAVRTAANLDGILGLLEKVAPFLSMLFPSFGPIIDALLKIIPLILSIFG